MTDSTGLALTRLTLTNFRNYSGLRLDVSARLIALSGPNGEGGQMDMAGVEGQVRANKVKQVSDFVASHPDESVSILRSWLHETA